MTITDIEVPDTIEDLVIEPRRFEPLVTLDQASSACLLKAADLIDEHGWLQGHMGSIRDGFCAVGAIDHAANNILHGPEAGDLVDAAVVRLAAHVGTDAITRWNDTRPVNHTAKRRKVRARSRAAAQAEVTTAMRQAATRLTP